MKYTDIEHFIEHNTDNLNLEQQTATEAVDYCRLRNITEIKSDMCEPTPTTTPINLPTQECIKPAVPRTNQVGKEVSCALYRYDSPDKIHSILKENGYYIFKKMIPDKFLQIAKEYIKDDSVNYNRLNKEFIEPHMLSSVGKEIDRNIINIKYRVSNNNNSTDAASFHRDLHNYSKNKNTRVYTILTYIDGGNMELIPGSNGYPMMNISQAFHFMNKRKSNILEPGDILMFEGTTIHRGIFYKNQKDRRLIQLFDCVFDYDYDYYMRTIIHTPCRDKCDKGIADFLVKLNKSKTISNLMNFFIYFNTALGYSKFGLSPFINDRDVKYLSTDSNQARLNIINDTFQLNNLYIMNVEGEKNWDIKNKNKFLFFTFSLTLMVILILLILVITILSMVLKIIIKN